jgi:hypothetical protein
MCKDLFIYITHDNHIFFNEKVCKKFEEFYVEQTTIVDENPKDPEHSEPDFDEDKDHAIFWSLKSIIQKIVEESEEEEKRFYPIPFEELIDEIKKVLKKYQPLNENIAFDAELKIKKQKDIRDYDFESSDIMIHKGKLSTSNEELEKYHYTLIYFLQDIDAYIDRAKKNRKAVVKNTLATIEKKTRELYLKHPVVLSHQMEMDYKCKDEKLKISVEAKIDNPKMEYKYQDEKLKISAEDHDEKKE